MAEGKDNKKESLDIIALDTFLRILKTTDGDPLHVIPAVVEVTAQLNDTALAYVTGVTLSVLREAGWKTDKDIKELIENLNLKPLSKEFLEELLKKGGDEDDSVEEDEEVAGADRT